MNQNQSIPIKRDLIVSLVIGEILAWLILILAGQTLSANLYTKFQLAIYTLPIYFPIICIVCLYIAYLVNKKITFVYQVAKFALVGGLNTLVDWGIVALLFLIFEDKIGIKSNKELFSVFVLTITVFSIYKAISFITATINSYLWNKFWTFTRTTKEKTSTEMIQFFVVSIIGFIVNVGIASWVFGNVDPLGALNDKQWGMLAAVIATAASMIWNFLGYKFIVFDVKKPEKEIS